jgi:putative multicomponent Na+:H+ antiporter subunit B
MNNLYLAPIVFLLPLSSLFVVLQVNPYNALVMRGILGAISALVYAILGSADVALTDALVGTMLSITLYAIAVRSSLRMRMGVVNLPESDDTLQSIRDSLKRKFMRLEVVNFRDENDLSNSLQAKDIHSAYFAHEKKLLTRIPKLHEILANLNDLEVVLTNCKS